MLGRAHERVQQRVVALRQVVLTEHATCAGVAGAARHVPGRRVRAHHAFQAEQCLARRVGTHRDLSDQVVYGAKIDVGEPRHRLPR